MTPNFVFVVVEQDLNYYIDLFLKFKQVTKKPATVTWYKNVLGYYRDAIQQQPPTWPPTVTHCLTFMETFKVKGLKDYSRNNYYRGLRSWLNWLKKFGYISQSPLEFLDAIPAPKPLPKAPPEEDMSSMLFTIEQRGDSWHDIRDLALFFVALDTGARPGELAAMQVDDVDLINRTIRVHSNKDYEDRELVFTHDVASMLTIWKKKRQELGVSDELRHFWVSDYQHKGFRPFTSSGIRQRLHFWQEKTGIDQFTTYAIRHAYAIYSLRNLADLLDIRDQMGHASITTTAKYTKVVNQGRCKRHQETSPLSNLNRNRISS